MGKSGIPVGADERVTIAIEQLIRARWRSIFPSAT